MHYLIFLNCRFLRDVKRVKPKSSGEDYDKIVEKITVSNIIS